MSNTLQSGLFRRAVQVRQSEGCGQVLRRAGAKLGTALFKSNSGIWFGRDLTAVLPEAMPGVVGEVSVVEPVELAAWLRSKKQLAWAADERELAVAEKHAHHWTKWTLQGETVAFCKVGGGRVFLVDFDRTLDLPEALSFLSDVYVVSHMRGKGIGRELLLKTMGTLIDSSFTRMACHIPSSNKVSLRLFESVGFRAYGKIRFTRIAGVAAYSVRPERMLEKIRLGGGET